MQSTSPALALALASAVLCTTAQAAVLRVPQDFATIQQAIDTAQAGDTVSVAPGIYTGRVTFGGRDIILESTDGPATTILDGQQKRAVVVFRSKETRATILRGFTIRNGRGDTGGGVVINGASPTVTHNIIADNSACNGHGIAATSSGALITHNEFRHNVKTYCDGGIGGGAIAIIDGVDAARKKVPPYLEFSDNLLEDNENTYGGGIFINGAYKAQVLRNVIRDNHADDGGGYYAYGDTYTLVADNLLYANQATRGGGYYALAFPNNPVLTSLVNNTIADNFAVLGPEMYLEGSFGQIHMSNSILWTTHGQSVGLYCLSSDGAPPHFNTNIIATDDIFVTNGVCEQVLYRKGNSSARPGLEPDYSLAPDSPAIDAGTDALSAGQPGDLLGNPRIVDGNGDGVAHVDLGAIERPRAARPAPVVAR